MRDLVITILSWMVSQLPLRVRGVLAECCIDNEIKIDRLERILPRITRRLNLVELAARGTYGIIVSSVNDTVVLPEYARTGSFATEVVREFSEFFAHEGGTYIDIGANIGLTTIPIAQNPKVRCIAFEPEPRNFGFLTRNVNRNVHGSEVALHQMAIFKHGCQLDLGMAQGNIGDHRLNLDSTSKRQTVSVEAVPLDDFLGQVSGPIGVKIDTQGAEPYVVAGGAKVLARCGLLAMEFCPYLMRQLGGDIQLVLDLVATFPMVAVMKGGIAEVPNYLAPEQAIKILSEKLVSAANTDEDYLDILARRNPKMPASK